MEKIQDEIFRVREKYSTCEWVGDQIAQSLVTYMNEYIIANQYEINTMS